MGELINGRVSVNAIRKVEYRDLLGRQPIDLDTEKIGGYLSGRIVFVSGAGGSIKDGLEMGDPIKIDHMARDLIKFSGFEPDVDIKVDYTGLRPGEKLYEELMTDQENVIPTCHNKIMVFNGRKVDLEQLNGEIETLRREAEKRDVETIRQQFKKIVPEYIPHP